MRPANAALPRPPTNPAGEAPPLPAVDAVANPANLPPDLRVRVVEDLRSRFRTNLPPVGQIGDVRARDRSLSAGFAAVGIGCSAIATRSMYRVATASTPDQATLLEHAIAGGALLASAATMVAARALDRKAKFGERVDEVMREFVGAEHEGIGDLADADRRLAFLDHHGIEIEVNLPYVFA